MKEKKIIKKPGTLCRMKQGIVRGKEGSFFYVEYGPMVRVYDSTGTNDKLAPKYSKPYLTKIPRECVEYFYTLNDDDTVNKLIDGVEGCYVETKPFRLGEKLSNGGWVAAWDNYKTIVLPSEYNVLAPNELKEK